MPIQILICRLFHFNVSLKIDFSFELYIIFYLLARWRQTALISPGLSLVESYFV